MISRLQELKVKTLASARAIKVNEKTTIDPTLLFQRFLVVSKPGKLSLDVLITNCHHTHYHFLKQRVDYVSQTRFDALHGKGKNE